jgi:hypothetical protein
MLHKSALLSVGVYNGYVALRGRKTTGAGEQNGERKASERHGLDGGKTGHYWTLLDTTGRVNTCSEGGCFGVFLHYAEGD